VQLAPGDPVPLQALQRAQQAAQQLKREGTEGSSATELVVPD
jgi:hypothetical protein